MIVFWVALVAIVVIVALKRRELRTGKSPFLTTYGVKIDERLRYWYHGVRNFFSTKTLTLISVWCRTHLAPSPIRGLMPKRGWFELARVTLRRKGPVRP